MSHEKRQERIALTEQYLRAILDKNGSIKIWEFKKFIMEKLEVTEVTAISYIDLVKRRPDFDHNGFDIFYKNKKPEVF